LSINPIIVSAGATLAGVGYALLVPAWNALVMDWIPANARGLFLGAVATAQGIGLAAGPTLGGALWERVGVYAPFQFAALLLGEKPTPLQGIGGAVMLFGVWWINRPDGPPA